MHPSFNDPSSLIQTKNNNKQAAYVTEVINALGLAKSANTIIGPCSYLCDINHAPVHTHQHSFHPKQ